MDKEIISRREFLGTSVLAVSTVAVESLTMPSTTFAQSTAVKEPAVIGYPNRNGVTIERVTYPARNMGTTMVANLFKPVGFNPNRKYAAIVVTHPFGGVKEQTAGLYAQRRAEKGFITVAYDASHQGESGGEPPHVQGAASELTRQVRVLQPALADGLLSVRSARDDLASAGARHCRFQGRHVVLE